MKLSKESSHQPIPAIECGPFKFASGQAAEAESMTVLRKGACGADLRGGVAVHTSTPRPKATDELVTVHAGSDDGGAPGGREGCRSSGASQKLAVSLTQTLTSLGEVRRPAGRVELARIGREDCRPHSATPLAPQFW